MWRLVAIAALCAAPDGTQFGLTTGQPADSGRETTPPPSPPPPPPAPPVTCDPNRAPRDRSCTQDSDCTFIWRTVSCCGTRTVEGVNRADVARYQAQERPCSTQRRCGCAEGPTQLDDGTRMRRRGTVAVACRANLCTTFLASAPAQLTSTTVQTLPRCAEEECGPSPAYPNWTCPDGVSRAGLGPCVRQNGRCGWAHLECP
jgi:hypothetical protein